MRIYLCGAKGCCPTIEFKEEGVVIKEKEMEVTLNPEVWNNLVRMIKEGALGEI